MNTIELRNGGDDGSYGSSDGTDGGGDSGVGANYTVVQYIW